MQVKWGLTCKSTLSSTFQRQIDTCLDEEGVTVKTSKDGTRSRLIDKMCVKSL